MLGPGSTIGGLRIDALIGRGSMGEVWRGEQLALRRPVAIKRIADHVLAQDQAVARFQREAQCLARVQSPHVVAVHDFARLRADDGAEHWLLVMELVEGGRSLRAAVGAPLPWAAATALALHIAQGLAAAAELGIIHRDVKPDNVLVSARGIAKLVDFGLARAVDSTDMTAHGAIVGTPTYMSPEACRGEAVDARSDLYSLGATWYHLLAQIAPSVPPPIAALVHRCLAKLREDRPEDAAALVRELQALSAQGLALPATVPVGDWANASADAATEPTRLSAPAGGNPASAATAPTLLLPDRPRAPRRRAGLAAAGLVAATAVAATTAFVLLRDPFPAARAQVEQACAAGDFGLALHLSDSLIARWPARGDALDLERQVITAEVTRVIATDSFAQARALLAERRQGREWFDGEPLAIAIDIKEAQTAAAHGDRDGAEKLFTGLRQRHPHDTGICVALLAALGSERAEPLVVLAAADAVEGMQPPPPAALAALALAQKRWDPLTADAKRIRADLIRFLPQSLDNARADIETGTADDPDPRVSAYLLLKESGQLTPVAELRYHVRNLIELESRFSVAGESLDWLEVAVAAPDWPARKAAAGIAPFADVEGLHHADERETRIAKLLVRAFVPEITAALPTWIAATDEDHEDFRFNAWRLLHDADPDLKSLAAGFDDFAFHATTLRTFDPWNDSPPLEAALAYFQAQPATRREDVRAALLAGEQHVEDRAQMVDRNMPGTGRGAEMRANGARIRAVRLSLPATP
jgi:serine/threonine protein kinase